MPRGAARGRDFSPMALQECRRRTGARACSHYVPDVAPRAPHTGTAGKARRSAAPEHRMTDVPAKRRARRPRHRHPRRARAQSQEHRRRHSARPAGGVHRPVRLGQVLARLRHHLCRGPAPLRRESLSAYARQFLEMMQKPDVDQIDGLSPAISIEQKTTSKNPRSTVGTVTEIYDYMRLLWARVGVPYSPATGLPIESQTVSQMVDRVLALPEGTRIYVLAPVVRGRKGEYRKELAEFLQEGLPARQDRRRVLRDRRGQAARQEIHPRHRRGGRPPGGESRHRHAAGGFARAVPQARRRPGGGRTRRHQGDAAPPPTAAATPTPSASSSRRNSPARCPASPFRRSSRGCSRSTIRSAPARNAAGSALEQHIDADLVIPDRDATLAQRRHRALGEIVVALLHPDARRAGQALPLHARHQMEGPAEEDAGRHPLRLRRGRDQIRL